MPTPSGAACLIRRATTEERTLVSKNTPPPDSDDLTGRILKLAEDARVRLRAQERRRRHARLAEQATSLVAYYGPRPLRAVPLSQFLAEGWWAA
jgi:hypothetical protein